MTYVAHAVALLHQLDRRHVTLAEGLSEAELTQVEERLGFTFAPDHRELLANVLPLGEGWPDWRAGDEAALRADLWQPHVDLLRRVSRGAFWLEEWGEQPRQGHLAVQVARLELVRVPVLVPLRGSRRIPNVPALPDNPVLSYYPGDTIVLAPDLVTFLEGELPHARRKPLPLTSARRIPFWSRVVEIDAGGTRSASHRRV